MYGCTVATLTRSHCDSVVPLPVHPHLPSAVCCRLAVARLCVCLHCNLLSALRKARSSMPPLEASAQIVSHGVPRGA
jgi:hypothetical protein